jgi:hypothetical protein
MACIKGKCMLPPNDRGPAIGHNADRPRMPNRVHAENDPRVNTPRDTRRVQAGNNRIDRRDNTGRVDARGGTIRRGDISGSVHINVSGGREIQRGRGNVHADASGGNVRTGNIDRNANVRIQAHGGTAVAIARGGSHQISRHIGAGYGDVGTENEGFGRVDGNNQAAGFIRTNISPGRTTGSFMPVPQPITRAGSTAILQEGETLRQLSKRAYGYEKWWPRIVALNNTYDFANREIPAGTVLRIG